MPPGGPQAGQDEPIEVMRAAKFLFSDTENWKMNLLFAVLLQFIPVVGPLTAAGWQAEISKRLVQRRPQPIPKFDFGDFVAYLQNGLIPFGVTFVLTFPAIIVWYFGTFIGLIASSAIAAAVGIPELALLFTIVVSLFSWAFLILFLTIFVGAASLRAELSGSFGQAFAFGAIFKYCKATWKRSLGHGFVLGALATVAIIAGILACFVGVYVVAGVIPFAALHLRYQIYSKYLAEGGEPIPLGPNLALTSEGQTQASFGGPPPGAPPQGGFAPPGGQRPY